MNKLQKYQEMLRLPGLKHHQHMLDKIRELTKPKWGKMVKLSSTLSGLKAQFKPYKKAYTIEFRVPYPYPKKNRLDVGQSHKKINIEFKDSTIVLEDVFLGNHSVPYFKGQISRFHTKGFSTKTNYYYRIVIPLERELNFHYNIEQTAFSSDLVYTSRCSTKANIEGESIEVCCINEEKEKGKKNYFLVIESDVKQNFESFSHKANSLCIALGYLSGYYAGDNGYFFCYGSKIRKKPKHIRFTEFRDSIISGYKPVYSNAHGFLHRKKSAGKYQKLLRPVNLQEFSLLVQRINASLDLSSAIMLMLESSVASLLFMPGGYAIALETISDIIICNSKLKIAPIKDKKLSKSIRGKFKEIVDSFSGSILPDDLKTLYIRIDQFNQITNKARLKAPFEILKLDLLEEDLKILQTRNDFLHGRVPDLTGAGKDRPIDRVNRDLYYCAIRFYTLLNMVILKWVGFDNRVVNYPKINEDFTRIKLKEEPFKAI